MNNTEMFQIPDPKGWKDSFLFHVLLLNQYFSRCIIYYLQWFNYTTEYNNIAL